MLTYYLSSFLPLSSLSAPSLPIKTLHELNLLASNLSDLLAKESSSTAKLEKLLAQKYNGVTQLDYSSSGLNFEKEITVKKNNNRENSIVPEAE